MTTPADDAPTTWRPRDSRGHYLASRDVHTMLEPDAWDDTCRHTPAAAPEPIGETFGHEPFEYDGVPICRRCFIHHRSYLEAVAWPCTSAIVLGLEPRPVARAVNAATHTT